jgi:hypothetical protein
VNPLICTVPLHTAHYTSQYRPSIYEQMIENILAMEQRRPPEYIIEVFADPSSVKDVVRGIFPWCERHKTYKLIAALRNFTHDLLSQIFPFYSTKDEGYSRSNTAIC